ncbi:uncharacterized protein BJ171DRAFT_236941 [Polychytrium aggregatum]|uniref:uncharacterized protein n=1 Tax=Polychytrium aggregatum TaxID=110093 RepID=UPI0022FDD187|nr:uncharacterized protein BJ171DRAFT_236941 [Polychytrium aggregatum]KAI9208246.1 hypothetical protein BJ171DRAFT_236941 [Polychytrium aggregatum]
MHVETVPRSSDSTDDRARIANPPRSPTPSAICCSRSLAISPSLNLEPGPLDDEIAIAHHPSRHASQPGGASAPVSLHESLRPAVLVPASSITLDSDYEVIDSDSEHTAASDSLVSLDLSLPEIGLSADQPLISEPSSQATRSSVPKMSRSRKPGKIERPASTRQPKASPERNTPYPGRHSDPPKTLSWITHFDEFGDSDDELCDEGHILKDQGVLALQKGNKTAHVPALVTEYHPATKRYSLLFPSGHSQTVSRGDFYTRKQPEFFTVRIEDSERFDPSSPNPDYRDPQLEADLELVSSSVQSIFESPEGRAHSRAYDEFAVAFQDPHRTYPTQLVSGPFDVHQIGLITAFIKARLFSHVPEFTEPKAKSKDNSAKSIGMSPSVAYGARVTRSGKRIGGAVSSAGAIAKKRRTNIQHTNESGNQLLHLDDSAYLESLPKSNVPRREYITECDPSKAAPLSNAVLVPNGSPVASPGCPDSYGHQETRVSPPSSTEERGPSLLASDCAHPRVGETKAEPLEPSQLDPPSQNVSQLLSHPPGLSSLSIADVQQPKRTRTRKKPQDPFNYKAHLTSIVDIELFIRFVVQPEFVYALIQQRESVDREEAIARAAGDFYKPKWFIQVLRQRNLFKPTV